MRTLRPRVAGLVLAATSVAALTGSVVGAAPPGTPAATSSVGYFWTTGPDVTYTSNLASGKAVTARELTVPDDGARVYDAVFTMGFRYRTQGRAPYSVSVSLRRSRDVRVVPTQPESLPVRSTLGRPDSGTVVLRATGLVPGETYALVPSADATYPRGDGKNRIALTGVVIDVRLTPR